MGLKFSTAKAIIKTFRVEGRVGKKKHRSRKSRPWLTMENLEAKLAEKVNKVDSLAEKKVEFAHSSVMVEPQPVRLPLLMGLQLPRPQPQGIPYFLVGHSGVEVSPFKPTIQNLVPANFGIINAQIPTAEPEPKISAVSQIFYRRVMHLLAFRRGQAMPFPQ
eukprot:TRINITY_DN9788_c0_g1_i3.p1 TRINITY_DN9788_c0_g1~~TRINITY_DN9788_c0_g1_i3.p1  ORF type:complete len:162 (+),score=21.80 TRINITY_DN9788_c0_g1_i3:278-763(+)